MTTDYDKVVSCFHCGQDCPDEPIWVNDKSFCCEGCRTVFEILNENDLCEYYNLDKNPGTKIIQEVEKDFAYLNDVAIQKQLLTFQSDNYSTVTFFIPAIHCVSCIWLLENLGRLAKGITRSTVTFAKKTVTINFNSTQISLGKITSVLSSIGYPPKINLDAAQQTESIVENDIILKLTLAGFCFGNVMLFSFPEYLGLDNSETNLTPIFSWLNLALSWPVLVYSARGYLYSALKSFKQKQINIDVPIAAGLIALFVRSHYDIIYGNGPGYFDSFTGLVFFLLIGRWFQSKTYDSLSYERDFKSYFPLAVNKLMGEKWHPVIIYVLEKGDTIRIRNMEIIPADSELLVEEALIDYSFVTGESKPVKVQAGSLVYAGGRLIGQPITLKVLQKTSQSHLTSLWNNSAFKKKDESHFQKLIDKTARIFTWVVLGIAVLTGLYWYYIEPTRVWLTITSVLMVACPCALALTAPFTYGTMLRSFGRYNLYLKNTDVIERLANIDTVVFDKTGTVTFNQEPEAKFEGRLSAEELNWVKNLASGSTHPLSKLISQGVKTYTVEIESFKELPGRGVEGVIQGNTIKVGSALFTDSPGVNHQNSTQIFVSINGESRGYFSVALNLRKDLKAMITRLGDMCVALLSGDRETDKTKMKLLFGCKTKLLFNQNPHDKLNYIRDLQNSGKKVLMVGDGLNDSGALKQADVGIAVTDDTGVFTPASDGIIRGDQLNKLDKMLALARSSSGILKTGFIISFVYNAVALSFAITGHLSPIIAAILMPLSSISVVAVSSLAVTWMTNHKLAAA